MVHFNRLAEFMTATCIKSVGHQLGISSKTRAPLPSSVADILSAQISLSFYVCVLVGVSKHFPFCFSTIQIHSGLINLFLCDKNEISVEPKPGTLEELPALGNHRLGDDSAMLLPGGRVWFSGCQLCWVPLVRLPSMVHRCVLSP